MTNPLYSELRVLADELLAEFGRDVVFVRVSKQGVVDPLTGAVTRVVLDTQVLKTAIVPASGGTLEAFDVRFMTDVRESTDLRFGIVSSLQADGTPSSFMPEPGDEATFDGRTWTVMGNTPLNVDGTPVTYSVGFRGP